jgi:hypothetical protein
MIENDPRKKAAAILSTMTEKEISNPGFYEKLLSMGEKVRQYDNQLLAEAWYKREAARQAARTPEEIKQELLWNNWFSSQIYNKTCWCCGKPRTTGRFYCSSKCYWVKRRRNNIKVVKSQ